MSSIILKYYLRPTLALAKYQTIKMQSLCIFIYRQCWRTLKCI